MPLIDCTKVDGDLDFDLITNKARGREAEEQTQLRDDRYVKTYDEEVCIINKIKQAKNSDI